MLNLFKADLYRIFKSKSFYITTGLLLVFVIGNVFAQSMGSIGMITEEKMANMDAQALNAWTGIQATINMITMMGILQYFIIPLFISLVGADFVSQTYKNTLTTGVSRVTYYATKMITAFVLCIIISLLFVSAAFIVGTIRNGVGDASFTVLIEILKNFGLKLLVLFCITLLGISTLMLTKSKVAAILVCILLPLLLQVLTQVPGLEWIMDYNIFIIIENLEFIEFTPALTTRFTILGSIYLLLTTVGATLIFNKKSL